MGFQKLVVIDCRGHLLGRLASVVAKQLLWGQKIVVVRTEELNIGGPLKRNHKKYMNFLHKTANTNPRRGPRHYRSPARIFWRAVRGMLPHKTPRGMKAIKSLKAFEGVPPTFAKFKKACVPEALRILRLRPGREYTILGELAVKVGWKYSSIVSRLEATRKAQAKPRGEKKLKIQKKRAEAKKRALAKPEVAKMSAELVSLGYNVL